MSAHLSEHPSEWTLRHGRTLALANKESLVMAGAFLTELAARSGSTILPVDSEHCALHQCLRKCLSKLYPQIREVRLMDYKVRVLDSHHGTAAKVRVLIEWSDHKRSWITVGVSDNVIEASWKALVDAIRLELMRLTAKDASIEKAVEDYCWGV